MGKLPFLSRSPKGGGGRRECLCIQGTRLMAPKTDNTKGFQAGQIQKASWRRWPCKRSGFQSTEMVEREEHARPARGGVGVTKGVRKAERLDRK